MRKGEIVKFVFSMCYSETRCEIAKLWNFRQNAKRYFTFDRFDLFELDLTSKFSFVVDFQKKTGNCFCPRLLKPKIAVFDFRHFELEKSTKHAVFKLETSYFY